MYKVLCLSDNFLFITGRIFLNFVLKLDRFCDIKVYGPKTYSEDHTCYTIPEEKVLMKYNTDITALDLVKEYNPDIILIILYNKTVLQWLPKELYTCGVPVVILEDDHYENTPESIKYKGTEVLNYYYNNKITFLLRRHFYKTKVSVPSLWFPQSANEEEFKPYYGDRINKIGFAGSFESTPWYQVRRNAIEHIGRANLLADSFGKFLPQEYPEYIIRYKGTLGCSGGILHTPLAKMFECMLSNTPYLTNWFHQSHLLFGIKEYAFIYKDDCSDIVKKANIILNDPDYVTEVTKNALEVVQKEHTDFVRIGQLYEILSSVIQGKEPPKKWGF